MTALLTKSRRVAHLGVASTIGGALFTAENSSGEQDHVLTLDYADWGDMGRPAQVTVTIEPGDLLTDEEF